MTPEKLQRITSIEGTVKSARGLPPTDPKVEKLLGRIEGDVLWLTSQIKADQAASQSVNEDPRVRELARQLDEAKGEALNAQTENSVISDKLSRAEEILDKVTGMLEVSSYGEIEEELKKRLEIDDGPEILSDDNDYEDDGFDELDGEAGHEV